MKTKIRLSLARFAFMATCSCACVAPLALVSCGPEAPDATIIDAEAQPEESAPALAGSFSVDGKTYPGKISTQIFPATKQFSVVCQNDDFGFVQITFSNEADARKPQTVKLVKMAVTKANDPGTAHLNLSPFSGNEFVSLDEINATATIANEGAHTVATFENAELSNNTGDAKKTVSGKVMY